VVFAACTAGCFCNVGGLKSGSGRLLLWWLLNSGSGLKFGIVIFSTGEH
jgi:hypothetical protein